MKISKLLLLLMMTSVITSCSDDEEDFNFVGNWELSTITVTNTSNESNEYNLNKSIEVDESCMFGSALTFFPNNTAILKLTSTVTNTIEVVEGTTNELEQIVTCEPDEDEIILTWATGDYRVENEDGTVSEFSSDGYETVRLSDQNGTIVMSGFVTFDGSLAISPTSISENPIVVEIEGEEIEFTNGRVFILKR